MDARERRRRDRQYLLDLGPDRQFRPDQLWRRQGRYLGTVERAGDRGPEIQHPDLDARPGRADPHDRRPAALQGEPRRGAGPGRHRAGRAIHGQRLVGRPDRQGARRLRPPRGPRDADDGNGRLDAAVYGMEGRGYRDPRRGNLLLRRGDQEVGAAIQMKSFRGDAIASNPEPRDSGFASRPGMTDKRIDAHMTKLTAQAAGTFAIAPTPFHDDGRIDEKSIDRLTDFYADVGCDGVTVLGILGEAPKLDATEAEQVAVRFVKRAKDMQIIVGVSAPGFATMRALAKASMDAGAAGVMIAPPPHLRTDDQITCYFKLAQEAIGDEIPWVLQDYPLTLNVIFTPAVIRKIVMDSPSCVMLKHEDWPGLEKISTLRGYQKDGSLKPMSILVGNGGLFLDFEMERGADG